MCVCACVSVAEAARWSEYAQQQYSLVQKRLVADARTWSPGRHDRAAQHAVTDARSAAARRWCHGPTAARRTGLGRRGAGGRRTPLTGGASRKRATSKLGRAHMIHGACEGRAFDRAQARIGSSHTYAHAQSQHNVAALVSCPACNMLGKSHAHEEATPSEMVGRIGSSLASKMVVAAVSCSSSS